jgi:hypothetical protein
MDSKHPQKDLAYLRQQQQALKKPRPTSMADYKEFCRLALKVKRAHPEYREDVAYELACVAPEDIAFERTTISGSPVGPISRLAIDLAASDTQGLMGNGLSLAQLWEKLEALVEQLPERSSMKDLEHLIQRQRALNRARPISMADYKEFCRLALEVKHAHPEYRADVAYELVCVAPDDDRNFEGSVSGEIMQLAMALEVPYPDDYLDLFDGLSFGQKWTELEALVEQLPDE